MYLDIQSGEVGVEVLRVIDIRTSTHRTNHLSDVFVSHCDGEVLLEAFTAHRALTGGE